MLQAIDRFKQIFPDLNKREFTEMDCWRFVQRHKIYVHHAPLVIEGYYGKKVVRRRWRDYILLDSNLYGLKFLLAFLHEIGHVCLHSPLGSKEVLYKRRENAIETKFEIEADAFKLLAAFPLEKFKQYYKTPFDEMHPDLSTALKERQRLYEKIWQ